MRRGVGQVALERALSKLGIASRTTARQWILEGRVKVNGHLRQDPLFAVNPERAKIEIDEVRVEGQGTRVFLLHKPRGLITTRSDEKGRLTVFSLLPPELANAPGLQLHAVGRLDAATTGLLLLTNDTRLSSHLTDPQNEIPRVYLVTVRGQVTDEKLLGMKKGVEVDGELLRARKAECRKASARESHLVLELTEGKNREIRRLLLALGHEVTQLKRVSFGRVSLGELEVGQILELSAAQIEAAFEGMTKPRSG